MIDMTLRELDLHITNRCNLMCSYCCYNSGTTVWPEMSISELKSVVTGACACGLKSLHINGGEPLLREDLEELVSFAIQEKGLSVRVQTNGLLLTPTRLKHLRESGLAKVMISLDGATPETHDRLRGRGTFASVVRAVESCLEAGLDVRVNSIATQENLHELLALAEMVFGLGIRYYSFYYFTPIGRGVNRSDLWVPSREWLSFCGPFLRRAKKLLASHPDCDIFFEVGYATRNTAKEIGNAALEKCGAGCEHLARHRDYMIVRCDGEAFPCILFVNEKRYLGNVLTNGIRAVWALSAPWEQLSRPCVRPECADCELSSVCIHECRGYKAVFDSETDTRCVRDSIAILCPIAKVSVRDNLYAGASDDIIRLSEGQQC